ncbi:MAG: hypothetical protein JNM63_14845, partial [Spirochaetia bacterium]|nr:hypothetical protein [Spirochaetia bacterium]
PLVLASAGYGAEDRPVPALKDNLPEIFSAGIKLYSMENPAARFQTNFQNGFGNAAFHQAAYDLYRRFLFPATPPESKKILRPEEVKNLATLLSVSGNALLVDSPAAPGTTWFLVRDPYWNDYSLLKAERRGDALEIEIRQTLVRIGGDLVAHVKEGGKDREISLSSGKAVVNLPKDSEIYFTKRNTYDGRYRIDWTLELEGKRANDEMLAKVYGPSVKDNRISL